MPRLDRRQKAHSDPTFWSIDTEASVMRTFRALVLSVVPLVEMRVKE